MNCILIQCNLRHQSVQSLSCVQLLATPWTAARQAFLSITNSWSLLKLRSIKSMMPSNHLILCYPLFLLLQSLPSSGSCPVSQLFTSGGHSVGASPSVSAKESALLSALLVPLAPESKSGWVSLGHTCTTVTAERV